LARRNRLDRKLNVELDELEQNLFQLKILYDKYFCGLERVEPMRERDLLRKHLREMMRNPINNSVQRYRFQTLRARWNSLDQYINRNLVMIERGTHPKMKFRANMRDRNREQAEAELAAKAAEVQRDRARKIRQEDAALKQIFDRYMDARKSCGQSTDIGYDSVREALRKQVRTMKSQYKCDSVKFRVTVENGKAKLKAVPVNNPRPES
jgi:hypothetical protein